MAYYVVLTVDVQEADAAKRQAFDERLGASEWGRLENSKTIYLAKFSDKLPRETAFENAQAIVSSATESAGIRRVDARCRFSE